MEFSCERVRPQVSQLGPHSLAALRTHSGLSESFDIPPEATSCRNSLMQNDLPQLVAAFARVCSATSAREATWSRFQHPPIVTAALSHTAYT